MQAKSLVYINISGLIYCCVHFLENNQSTTLWEKTRRRFRTLVMVRRVCPTNIFPFLVLSFYFLLFGFVIVFVLFFGFSCLCSMIFFFCRFVSDGLKKQSVLSAKKWFKQHSFFQIQNVDSKSETASQSGVGLIVKIAMAIKFGP